jgi:hypothetical protein
LHDPVHTKECGYLGLIFCSLDTAISVLGELRVVNLFGDLGVVIRIENC